MTNEKYFEIMDHIDEGFILDAAPVHKAKNHVPLKFILAVAIVAVVSASLILGAYNMGSSKAPLVADSESESSYASEPSITQKPDKTTDSVPTDSANGLEDTVTETNPVVTEHVPDYVDGLPTLTAELIATGYGQEGYLVYDISEIDRNSPFDPSKELESLPVYKNLAYDPYMQEHPTSFLSRDEMQDIAENIAARSNARILYHKCIDYVENEGFLDVTDDESITEGIIHYVLYTDKFVLSVGSLGSYSFSFEDDNAIPLPQELMPSGDYLSEDETVRIFKYLSLYYSDYVCENNIVGSIVQDYNFYGEPYSLYQKFYQNDTEDYVTSILNFSFNNYKLQLSEDFTHITAIAVPGGIARFTEKLGDYPTISYDEALGSLLEGNYLTTVDVNLCLIDSKVRRDSVHMTEIVYFTQSGNEYFIPYYRFYVLLDCHNDKSPQNLKDYGIFYVPAVKSKYFKNYSPKLGQWSLD